MKKFKVFIVKDDAWYAETLQHFLSLNPELSVESFASGDELLKNLYHNPDVITLDYSFPDTDGGKLLRAIQEKRPGQPVIILSGQDDVAIAVTLLKDGAYDYVVKDENTQDRLWKLINHIKEKGNDLVTTTAEADTNFNVDLKTSISGDSIAIHRVFGLLNKAVKTDITVSITGETETGKELAAKTIHENSARASKPLVELSTVKKRMSIFTPLNLNTWARLLAPLCLGALVMLPAFSNAQGVSINSDNSSADASSILELKSSSKGMLTPRMTTAERDAIVSPATGLLIYNTTTGAFNFYDSYWRRVGGIGYNSTDAGTSIQVASATDALIPGMTLVPGSGTYVARFNSTVFTGDTTIQGATDLTNAYNTLMGVAATNTIHAPTFGSGETLNAGVYAIAGAGSIVGTLTLDALGDPNAVFIFRFAGAFSTGASSSVILANGASACNVFWVAQGAVSLGATSTMEGTLIANNGAVSAGAGSSIIGRLFSTTGVASIDGLNITIPTSCAYLDLGILSSFAVFTSLGAVGNTGSSNVTGNLGTNGGVFTGFSTATVNGTLYTPGSSSSSDYGIFSIYQNGTLVPNSSRTRTISSNTAEMNLQAIATVSAGQAIEVRCRTDSGALRLENRILTLTKVQ
jgi:FixJ family two-component response regulator